MTKLTSITDSVVMVRVNYDLPIPISTERIDDSLSTIETLFENNNKVVLLTHWGRPENNDPKLSTKNLIPYIEESISTNSKALKMPKKLSNIQAKNSSY
jgi:3-phosphoglycerate kinase